MLSSGRFGGAERSAIAALRHRPDDVDVQAILLSPGDDAGELRHLGVTSVSFPPLAPRFSGRVRLVSLLARQLRAAAPDVIYAVGNKAVFASVIPAGLQRVPLVWNKCDSWYDRRGASLIARTCTRVVAPTYACGRPIPRGRLAVLDPSLPISEDTVPQTSLPPATIGSVGRLEPRKGHEDLIRAAARLRENHPDIRIMIAGAPVPYAPRYIDHLRSVADEHQLGGHVEFLGHVSRIEDFLRQLTMLVSASYRDRDGRGGESFGLAIAEAGWVGIPVVVTSSGGELEHVQPGVNGLVVPPRNPQALANAVSKLLADPATAARMGVDAARLARRRFDPQSTADRLFALLRACAA